MVNRALEAHEEQADEASSTAQVHCGAKLPGPSIVESESHTNSTQSASSAIFPPSRRSSSPQPSTRNAPTIGSPRPPRTSLSKIKYRSKRALKTCKETLRNIFVSPKVPKAQQTRRRTGREFSPTPPPSSQRNATCSSSSSPHRTPRGSRSIWDQGGEVLIVDEKDHERKRNARMLFDPQCREDVISTSFLATGFGLHFDDSDPELLACSITGHEKFFSIGRQSIRWWAPNLGNVYRFVPATCRVVRSDHFDLIIGQLTIDELEIFKPGMIAAFRSVLPGSKAKNVPAMQEEATQRRRVERQEKERHEKEKGEKERRDRRQVSSALLPAKAATLTTVGIYLGSPLFKLSLNVGPMPAPIWPHLQMWGPRDHSTLHHQ